MSLRRAVGTACFFLSLSVLAADAEDEAARFFRRGQAAYQHGNARAAASAFEEAYRLLPRGASLYNAGIAWEAAGERGRAADAYELALELATAQSRYLADAQRRLAALRKLVGVIRVSGPSSSHVSVAHANRLQVPARIHVVPGTHAVTAYPAEGEPEERMVSVHAGEEVNVVLATPARPEPPIEQATAPQPQPQPQPQTETENETEKAPPLRIVAVPVPTGPSAAATWGWVAIAASGATAGAAVALGVNALRTRESFQGTDYTDAGLRARADSLRTWTNVSWAIAATLAATGITLELLPRTSGASARLAPSGPGVGVVGRF